MTTAVAKAGKGKSVKQLSTLLTELVEARQHVADLLDRVDEVLAGASMGSEKQPRPSPLDDVKAVMAATAELRVANGNLSADRIAKLYGISLSQLADWLGRTRQAVAKTPDADSLQEPLGYFERVARLTAVMSADGFRKWLRMPHRDVAAKNPLELMATGEWQAMADYVDDILTGTPG